MLKANVQLLRLLRQCQEKHDVVCKDDYLPIPSLHNEALRHVLAPKVV